MKSYTDLEQSKKLAEILPLESADMRYHTISQYNSYPCDEIVYTIDFGKPSDIDVPCWSLAALVGVLPSSIKDSIGMVYSLNMNKEYIEYSNPNISSLYSAYIHTCGNDNLVDACYEMIIKLHELNLL